MGGKQRPPKEASALPHDERVWSLRPEVLLARGKCDLQTKEEKAVRGAVQEAITAYMDETVALAERNNQEREEMAAMFRKSAEEADEILIRKCTYDQKKSLKYRNKDADVISENIDQETALLQNKLNYLVRTRKLRTRSLLDLQKRLATMQVDLKYGADEFPEQERYILQVELQIEKTDQKIKNSQSCMDHYHNFHDKLAREKWFYEARLRNIQTFIQQDLADMEVCHDVMVKGEILAHDAAYKRKEIEEGYKREKGIRENDIKCIRKEVNKKDPKDDRKKATLAEVDLDKVLQLHQNMFEHLQQRRKTLCELDNWQQDYEELQNVVRATSAEGVTQQFESLIERNTYLAQELERVDTLRQSQKTSLDEKQIARSSILHTGEEAVISLDKQMADLESTVKLDKSQLELVQVKLEATGKIMTSAKTTVQQLLRSVKFVSRPQGWRRNPGRSETAGDLELLRLKMMSLQQRYEALGAPLRLQSQASILSDALTVPKQQYRINKMAHSALVQEEGGRVDDMEPMRNEMKKTSFDFTYKMTNQGRRPP